MQFQKFKPLLFGTVGALMLLSQVAFADPPANDNFSDAETISDSVGYAYGTNIDATREAEEPYPSDPGSPKSDNSLWFKWVAPTGGNVRFDTYYSNFDTVLGVYTGSSVNNMAEIASNNDVDDRTSAVSFDAVQGTTYYIDLAGYFSGEPGGIVQTGSYWLKWAQDLPPSISISNPTVTEDSSSSVIATFTVSLSAASDKTITVDCATSDYTATAPDDYEAGSGTLTFEPGETEKTLNVTVKNDAENESNEYFFVNLSNAVNASLDGSLGVATIHDSPPLVSVSDAPDVYETGRNATFTVSLSKPSNDYVTVDYATADGTATFANSTTGPPNYTGPADYRATSGTLTFEPGETIKTVDVPVLDEGQYSKFEEDDETFFLNLSNSSGLTVSDAQGQATIIDDEPTPTVVLATYYTPTGPNGEGSVPSDIGEEGNTTYTSHFTASLTVASSKTITVDYATVNDTATAPSDYIAKSGSLTFLPGEGFKPLGIVINGDSLFEATEQFLVNFTNPVNATVGPFASIRLNNDDNPPFVSINDVSVTEGNSGTTNATFTISLLTQGTLTPSGVPVTVNYSTEDSSASSSQYGGDYVATSGSVTFAPGETTKTVSVPVKGDLLDEADETFFVNISANGLPVSKNKGIGTIIDNDAVPTSLSVSDVAVTEGDTDTSTTATFTVSLSAARGRSVTVDYATADGTATDPADYTATTGKLTFAAGETSKTVDVTVIGDAEEEADETFTLNLANPTQATIADGEGIGTIVDNDAPATISVSDAPDVSEADGNATFTISLSKPADRSISVGYNTSNGTATAAEDFVTFEPGETTKTVEVAVINDNLDEDDETFFLNLTGPSEAPISDGQGVATILDDDAAPTVNVYLTTNPNDPNATLEGNTTNNRLLVVVLSQASSRTVTVDYATADDTATALSDYVAKSGTFTFAPGETLKNLNIVVNGDNNHESNEGFFVRLSNPVNANAGNQAIVILTNDDPFPAVSVSDVTVTEGSTVTGSANFILSLSAASDTPVIVRFSTADAQLWTLLRVPIIRDCFIGR